MSSAANSRLFLALWPDEAERTVLAELAQAVSGARAVKPDKLHMTLVFLGTTTAEQLACYEQALDDFTLPSLTLTLDRFGYWPRPRILWLGSSKALPVLTAVVLDLNRRLESCGFIPEKHPFSPHVTLARKFPGPTPSNPPCEPVSWVVSQIVLAESLSHKDGTHYQVLCRWPEG